MNLIYILIGFVVFVLGLVIILQILKRMKGSIQIIPEKYSYSAGENIQGKLILKLKKSVKSSKLTIGLRCEKEEKTYSKEGGSPKNENSLLFEFNQPLDGEKEYSPSEYTYDFSIGVPENVSQKLEGPMNTLVKSVQILSGKNSLVKWYLYSELKCKGVNLSKKIQINIV